jgi:actin-like ATPase involved in cell morphogenesis
MLDVGVDLGTTWTAAAFATGSEPARPVELGLRASAIPSVVALSDSGAFLIGEPASARARVSPGSAARNFKRRFGDPTPLVLDGSAITPVVLTSQLLRWVMERIRQQLGDPDRIALTHPASWRDHQLGLLVDAARNAEVLDPVLVAEPVAAATHYATTSRLDDGALVAVYDLGGGTFDAAVVRKTGPHFEIVGEPVGMDQLGGVDFDHAIYSHLVEEIRRRFSDVDTADPDLHRGLVRFHDECMMAKEQLSVDTSAMVPVTLPTISTELRITREEFERMIRPNLAATVEGLQRAVRSAGIDVDDLDVVLLVGGSSRIPLVQEMLSGELGVEVAVDTHPKYATALGACAVLAGEDRGAAAGSTGSGRAGLGLAPAAAAGSSGGGVQGASDGAAAQDGAAGAGERRLSDRSLALIVLAVVAGLIVVGIVVWVSAGGDETASTSTTVAESTSTVPSTTSTVPSTTSTSTSTSTAPTTSTTAVPVPDVDIEVSVPAAVRWTDTGVDLGAGDELSLEATGQVSHAAPDPTSAVGPEGDEREELQQFNRVESGSAVEGPHGALIGRIGEGEPFVVGSGTELTVTQAGRLQLGVNDDGVENNDGAFTVSVVVTSPGGA